MCHPVIATERTHLYTHTHTRIYILSSVYILTIKLLGQVYHQLTAAPQNWFACNDTVDGQWNYFLKWGVYSEDLTPPAGCLYTKLIQNFNVPGGASSRS